LTRRARRSIVITIVIAIGIIASWAGNVYAYQTGRLPEGRFLSHRIEITDGPGDSFMLYYLANSDDKRLPVTISNDALPNLRFYPIQEYMSFSRQKLYRLMVSVEPADEAKPLEAGDSRTIHSANVRYSDGTEEVEDVGNLIVYAEKRLVSDDTTPSIKASSSSSSNRGTGSASFSIKKPITLTGSTSAFLDTFGSAFHYELRYGEDAARYPSILKVGSSLKLSYEFDAPDTSMFNLLPISMRLMLHYSNETGGSWSQGVRIEHAPYPTESAIRRFVAEQRRVKS